MKTGQRLGAYTLIAPLGVGGTAQVYLARHEFLKRQVALKVLSGANDEARARFQHEFEAISRLSHPHLVRTYDFGQAEGSYFLAMEYIRGQSLADRIAAGHPGVANVLRWVQEILSALECCHQARILHRDIKPSNIMIDETGHARILDLGLARSLDRTGLTRTGDVNGTPLYIPPEILTGQTADERGDLYQVGLVMLECLTGRPAFDAPNLPALMLQIRTVEPSLPELDPAIQGTVHDFLREALAKDPKMRFASCSEALSVLRQLDIEPTGEFVLLPPPQAPPRNRIPWMWLPLLIGAAAVGFGVTRVLRPVPPRPVASAALQPPASLSSSEVKAMVQLLDDAHAYLERTRGTAADIFLTVSPSWRNLEAEGNRVLSKIEHLDKGLFARFSTARQLTPATAALMTRVSAWRFTVWSLLSRVRSTRRYLIQPDDSHLDPGDTVAHFSRAVLEHRFGAGTLDLLRVYFARSEVALLAILRPFEPALLAAYLDDLQLLTAGFNLSRPQRDLERPLQVQVTNHLAHLATLPPPYGAALHRLVSVLWVNRLRLGAGENARSRNRSVDAELSDFLQVVPVGPLLRDLKRSPQ